MWRIVLLNKKEYDRLLSKTDYRIANYNGEPSTYWLEFSSDGHYYNFINEKGEFQELHAYDMDELMFLGVRPVIKIKTMFHQ